MQVMLAGGQTRNLWGFLFDGLCSLQERAAHLLRVKTCGWYRGLIRDEWKIVLNGIQGSNEIGNIYVQGQQSLLMHVGAEKPEAMKVTVSSLLAYPLLHWASLLVGISGLYFFCLTIICQGHLTGRKYLQITYLMIV